MYEYVGPVFPPYESVSLGIVKPFHCSLHFVSPLAGDSWGGSETNRRHEHELRGVYSKMLLPVNITVPVPVHFYTKNRFNLSNQPLLGAVRIALSPSPNPYRRKAM